MSLHDPFVVFCLIIALFFIALELYLGYLRFDAWITRKYKLFRLGISLIREKNELIRGIGWATLRLVLWESEDNDDKTE